MAGGGCLRSKDHGLPEEHERYVSPPPVLPVVNCDDGSKTTKITIKSTIVGHCTNQDSSTLSHEAVTICDPLNDGLEGRLEQKTWQKISVRHTKHDEPEAANSIFLSQESGMGKRFECEVPGENNLHQTTQNTKRRKLQNLRYGTETSAEGNIVGFKKPQRKNKYANKVEILKDLEKGKPINRVVRKYGVSKSTVRRFKIRKDEILNQAKEEDLLANGLTEEGYCRTYRFVSQHQKIRILEELEKGEIVASLARKYAVSKSYIRKIQKEKDQILNRDSGSLKRDAENDISYLKDGNLSIHWKVEILEELDKGSNAHILAQNE